MWKQALLNGHLPEFDTDNVNLNQERESYIWPEKVLYKELKTIFTRLELPFLTNRHPELIPSVLRALLEISINFSNRVIERNANIDDRNETENKAENEDEIDYWEDTMHKEYLTGEDEEVSNHLSEEDNEEKDFESDLAESLINQFASAWAPPLEGLSSLDALYGNNHGLLTPGIEDTGKGGAGTGKGGFGLFDGVWQHTGWVQIKNLQEQLREMPELRDLIQSLGRRSSVDGKELRKSLPQIESSTSSLGVARSPYSPLEATGLKRSDTIEGLLPSEMMLLIKTERNENEIGERRRKLLFISKRAEKLLGSYENTGWIDQPSVPKKLPWKYYQKLPTTPGGPIIICLDTSWSMAGPRENLAKAVVLECSKLAAKQNRACYIMAFSGAGNINDFEIPVGSQRKEGLLDLLGFLGGSFRGGTDICSPLDRGSALIEENVQWGGADLLLVTDGELQNPPVRPEVMQRLSNLEIEKELEIHGLLVGRNQSTPLEMICTSWDNQFRVHNFLCKYDPIMILKAKSELNKIDDDNGKRMDDVYSEIGKFKDLSDQMSQIYSDNIAPSTKQELHVSKYDKKKSKLKSSTKLYAQKYNKNAEMGGDAFNQHFIQNPRMIIGINFMNSNMRARTMRSSALTATIEDIIDNDIQFNYIFIYKKSLNMVKEEIKKKHLDLVDIDSLHADSLSIKNETDFRSIISATLSRLGEGLIERDIEVKLLLLAVLCREHVILLGPPGTGKSELGKRLSALSDDGPFFERLLTKYTNPEELFGPLSLSALEKDEYVRKTEGYLPTASVAFLDEIFKANSAILNSLLTILNERQFDNGKKREKIPLLAVVAASNELPESQELDALYDRFLFRCLVEPVSDDAVKDLFSVVPKDDAYFEPTITEELTLSLSNKASKVTMSIDVVCLLRDLRAFMRDEMDPPVYCSDRRLVKAAAMLRLVAATHSRTTVSLLDCLILQHVMWNQPEDKTVIKNWLRKRVVPETGLYGFKYIIDDIQKRIIKDFKTENKIIEKKDRYKDIEKQIIQENDVYNKYELPYIEDLYKDAQTESTSLYVNSPQLNEILAMKYSLIKKMADYMILAKQCSGSKGREGL